MSDWVAGIPAVATSRDPLYGRRQRLLIMMLTATILFGVVGCSGEEPASAPETPAPSGPPRVVFYAEGNGTKSAAVTMRTESGGTIQKDVALPMGDVSTGKPGVESEKFRRGALLYLSLQNSEPAGAVTCRIEVDGVVIDEATSAGAYKIASCQGTVP